MAMTHTPDQYWASPTDDLLAGLGSRPEGLSQSQVEALRAAGGRRGKATFRLPTPLRTLLRQFESPLVLILIGGAGLSAALHNWVDAGVVLGIVLLSALFGFLQEHRANRALAALQNRLASKAQVVRGGQVTTIPASEVVPGDVIALAAGALVPADGVILSATDFLVTEAALTGESMPVEKQPGQSDPDAPLTHRTNCVLAGTSVRSGSARVLAVRTGEATELGDVARRIDAAEPETDFERGVRHFGYFLIRIMLVLVLAVLTTSYALGRPVMESLLFSVALAIGMTPELLPAITTITLSAGARMMADRGVIVRRLSALENLGSMDVLCTDKTGTLTEGTVELVGALAPDGTPDPEIARLAYLNAAFESGIENPLDQAIVAAGKARGNDAGAYGKLAEIPYDFVRRRLTIVLSEMGQDQPIVITKGSMAAVLEISTEVEIGGVTQPLTESHRQALLDLLAAQGREGYRVLGLARSRVDRQASYGRAVEQGMTFCGLLLFSDPPKTDAGAAISALSGLGIAVKMITGDNREIAAHVATAIGLKANAILSGGEIAGMKSEALAVMAERTDIFCEIDPQQKERIILALQKRGHVVGYMGDGINDAPALHAADAGISVDQAVDVARQSADVVLLRQDLGILRAGIECGRRTFANTQKYIAMATSANFGNMASMALVTPFLPFLPLLAKQVLFNSLLSDVPAIFISTDRVDPEVTQAPERWNMQALRKYMVVFGLVSSVFDLAAFAFLLKFVAAGEREFQTAWFTASLLTETLVILSLRTRKPIFRSLASAPLLTATLIVCALSLAVPYAPYMGFLFDFVALPLPVMGVLVGLALCYVLATEVAKAIYYRSA